MYWKRVTVLLLATVLASASAAWPDSPSLILDRAFVVVQDDDASASILHKLNLATGELIAVGTIGFQVTSLAFSSTGVLFGIDAELDLLVRIDPAQGVGVSVGLLGVDVGDALGSDLTFDTDDNLWMLATVGDLRGLYQIDRHTGLAAWVAAVDHPYAGALAAAGDRLFAANYHLGIIDSASGMVNPIGGEGVWAFQPQYMSFGSGSTLWAVAVCGVCGAPWDVIDLVTVDTETGGVVLHDIGWLWGSANMRGLAIDSHRRPEMVAPTFVD